MDAAMTKTSVYSEKLGANVDIAMGAGNSYGVNFSSVSYTHLDVYKRQTFILVFGQSPPRPSENSIFRHKISPFLSSCVIEN